MHINRNTVIKWRQRWCLVASKLLALESKGIDDKSYLAWIERIFPQFYRLVTNLTGANHIANTIETDPDAGWIFLIDQLNIHKSIETRAAFLSDPSHRIRFVYIPKHRTIPNNPMKQVRLAILSNAGGSGKTTLATHLAFLLAKAKYKVAVFDLDPQGSTRTN